MRMPTLGPSITTAGTYKWQTFGVTVRNEDTFAIAPGSPVVLFANGTDDGLAVVNLSSVTNAGTLDDLFIGVSPYPIAVNQVQDVVAYGMVTNALVVIGTRSAASAVIPSVAAIGIGDVLSLNSLYNALSRSSGGTALGYGPFVIAMQSFASSTTQASGATGTWFYASVLTTGSATSNTVNAILAGSTVSSGAQIPAFKAFVRAM